MSAYLSERVAYLRGLSDGLGIKEESAEDKLILKIIDVLQDISDAVDDVQGDVDELNEYVEAIDEDLSDLEEDLFNGEELEDDDFWRSNALIAMKRYTLMRICWARKSWYARNAIRCFFRKRKSPLNNT